MRVGITLLLTISGVYSTTYLSRVSLECMAGGGDGIGYGSSCSNNSATSDVCLTSLFSSSSPSTDVFTVSFFSDNLSIHEGVLCV